METILSLMNNAPLEADFVQMIAALYSSNTSCARVNGNWFEVNIGV